MEATMQEHDEVARARVTDPWTSWAAARSLGPLRPRQAAVAHCFERRGMMTLEELVAAYQGEHPLYPKQTDQSIRSRAAELQRADVLFDTGHTRLTATGRNARVLALKTAETLF
jgi:hypothetical protein